MAKFARHSGRLDDVALGAFVADVRTAIAEGTYLLVLPQFLVTGVVAAR